LLCTMSRLQLHRTRDNNPQRRVNEFASTLLLLLHLRIATTLRPVYYIVWVKGACTGWAGSFAAQVNTPLAGKSSGGRSASSRSSSAASRPVSSSISSSSGSSSSSSRASSSCSASFCLFRSRPRLVAAAGRGRTRLAGGVRTVGAWTARGEMSNAQDIFKKRPSRTEAKFPDKRPAVTSPLGANLRELESAPVPCQAQARQPLERGQGQFHCQGHGR